MQKTFIRMIVILIVVVMLTGCGVQSIPAPPVISTSTRSSEADDNDPEFFMPSTLGETSWQSYGFDRIIKESSGIVTARLDDIDFSEIGFVLHFSRTKVIWDGYIPENFTVQIYYVTLSEMSSEQGYSKKDIPYEEGNEYVLSLLYAPSVFSEWHYQLFVNTCIPMNGDRIVSEKISWYSQKGNSKLKDTDNNELNFSTVQEIEEYINTLVDTSKPSTSVYGVPYVFSDSPEDIVREADCIVQIHIDTMIPRMDDASRDIYFATTLDSFKEKALEELRLVFFEDTVKVGEEYLVCLIRSPGGGIPSYSIASKKNSVIPMEDTERVAQYLDLLEQYNKE